MQTGARYDREEEKTDQEEVEEVDNLTRCCRHPAPKMRKVDYESNLSEMYGIDLSVQ